jgi:hypothetical protein
VVIGIHASKLKTESIVRTRGQAMKEAETRLNNDNKNVHVNDLQGEGPKIPVKRSALVVSIQTSKLKIESPALQQRLTGSWSRRKTWTCGGHSHYSKGASSSFNMGHCSVVSLDNVHCTHF